MTVKYTLWDPTLGAFPLSQAMDATGVGQTAATPVNATTIAASGATTLNGTTALVGAVSGAGFVAAVQAIIEGDAPGVRYLPLTDVHSDNGLPLLTVTPSGTTAGISRTAGTSLALIGVTTSGAQTVNTKAIWEITLPSTYVAAANIPLLVDCVVATATDVTAASTVIAPTVYSVSAAGVETALAAISSQQIPLTTAAVLTFAIPGTGLAPGQRLVIELQMTVVTTTGGASFGQINSVGITA